jgi:hypothetical protein
MTSPLDQPSRWRLLIFAIASLVAIAAALVGYRGQIASAVTFSATTADVQNVAAGEVPPA